MASLEDDITILREQHTRLGWNEWLQKLYTTVGQVAVFGFLAYWAKSVYDNYTATKRARLAQAAMATAAASSSAAAANPGGTDAAAATTESQPVFNEVRAHGRHGAVGWTSADAGRRPGRDGHCQLPACTA